MYIYIYVYMYNICIYIYVHVIMKTMCPPDYHRNDFVTTQTLGYMMYELPQSHCGDNRESRLF